MKTALCASIPTFVVGHMTIGGLLGVLRGSPIGAIAIGIALGIALNIVWMWIVLRRDERRLPGARVVRRAP